MWSLEEPEPLCGTWKLLTVEPLCGEPGARFPAAARKLYWKNPKLSKLLGKSDPFVIVEWVAIYLHGKIAPVSFNT